MAPMPDLCLSNYLPDRYDDRDGQQIGVWTMAFEKYVPSDVKSWRRVAEFWWWRLGHQ